MLSIYNHDKYIFMNLLDNRFNLPDLLLSIWTFLYFTEVRDLKEKPADFSLWPHITCKIVFLFHSMYWGMY